jgi:HrpA-like RNA helicase
LDLAESGSGQALWGEGGDHVCHHGHHTVPKYFRENQDITVADCAIELGGAPYDVKVVTLERIKDVFPDHHLQQLCQDAEERMKGGEVPDWTRGCMHALMAKLLQRTAMSGCSVLVFLPGLAEIMDMANYLRTKMATKSVHVLHSVVAKEDQNLACFLVPSGERRVILATSMAESSVTIEGLSCIIDTGITRDSESQDLFGLTVLCDRWSDATVVRQCMGRVGRTQCGMDIRLFTEHVVAEYMPRW